MTTIHSWSVKARSFAWICLFFFVIHAPLLIHDLQNPEALVAADRGQNRLIKVERFIDALEQGHGIQHLQTTASPGDYIVQGLVIHHVGAYGLIVTQLLLQLMATLIVYKVGLRWLGSDTGAVAAAALYVVLPSSLYHPHVLATESIINPLFVVGFALILYSLTEAKRTTPAIVSAGIALSIVIAIRNQFFLYPLVLIALLISLSRYKGQVIALAVFAALSWLPVLALVHWTDRTEAEVSDHGLGRNLYNRLERIGQLNGFAAEAHDQGNRTVSLPAFLSLVAQHPSAYLRTLSGDLLNAAANPGTSTLFGWYLGWFPKEQDPRFWHRARDSGGISGVVSAIASQGALYAAVIASTVLLWGVVMLLSLVGLIGMLFTRSFLLVERMFVLLTILYSYATPLISGAVRWPHRSATDFLIALLCVYGVHTLGRRSKWNSALIGDPAILPRSTRGGSAPK